MIATKSLVQKRNRVRRKSCLNDLQAEATFADSESLPISMIGARWGQMGASIAKNMSTTWA